MIPFLCLHIFPQFTHTTLNITYKCNVKRRICMNELTAYADGNWEKILYHFFKYLFLFLTGGFTYFYIEILYRGYSHFSMIICGGLALIFCGGLNQLTHFRIPVILQMILSAVIITGLEFVTGYIVNMRMGLNVWDYSGMPYNLYGQVCLAFSFIWMILSLACIFIDDFIRWKIFDEEKAIYRWW